MKLPRNHTTCLGCGLIATIIIFGIVPTTCEEESTQTEDSTHNELKLYKALFKVKRKEHIAAIQKLIIVEDVAKRAALIEVMMNTIIDTVDKAKLNLDANNFLLGQDFPSDPAIKDDLSKILENTALFTDLIVRFPKPGHIFYRKHEKKWKTILRESVLICNQTGVYAGDYQLLLHSLKQEVGIGPKDEKYENPFKEKSNAQAELTQEERQELYEVAKRKKRSMDKKAKRTGPTMSKHSEL